MKPRNVSALSGRSSAAGGGLLVEGGGPGCRCGEMRRLHTPGWGMVVAAWVRLRSPVVDRGASGSVEAAPDCWAQWRVVVGSRRCAVASPVCQPLCLWPLQPGIA